jgi:hypothetical protein
MKDVALLRPIMMQGLFNSEYTKNVYDFKSWISSGEFIVRDILSSTKLRIEVNNEYSFTKMLVYDCCRMASASFETMETLHEIKKLPKSFGWIAIKCYYAAFFSAHSILRCFGYTCSQLEKGHVKLLNSYGDAVGLIPSMRVDGGFFVGEYNSDNREFILEKMHNTHEDTWNCLTVCLRSLSQEVLKVPGVSPKKQMLSASLDDLINILKNNGRLQKGNYLSQFRNAVNYRHEFHSWHPYGKDSIRSGKILALVSNWRSDVPPVIPGWKESMDTYNYFYACMELVNVCYQIINVIVDNSRVRNNLFRHWPRRLLQITSAA